jgi:predicted NBD/HSP70 family sugar kinase
MKSNEIIIAADIGGTNCRVGVVSEVEIIDSVTLSTPQNGDELFAQLGTHVSRFISRYDARIGAIGVPGPVNRSSDPVLVGPFQNIDGCDEVFDLSERLVQDNPQLKGFNVSALNDAEAATHAATQFYAKNNNEDPLMFLTISTGVGGDISVDYETLSYTVGLLTEIGHTPMYQSDGTYQTLEDLISGKAISRRYGNGQISSGELSRNPDTSQIWDQVGKDLARGIGVLVTSFGLRQVVIGGAVGVGTRHLIKEPLETELDKMFDVVPKGVAQSPEIEFVRDEHEQVLGLRGCFFALKRRAG